MKKLKKFGQHFLLEPNLGSDMVQRFIHESPTKNILEIGPGEGYLTKHLLNADINLKVIEIDERLITYLPEKFPELKNKLLHQDILHADFNQLFQGEPFAIIGNFPYNISSQIVFKIIENRHLVPYMSGMFQKEFANRLLSKVGKKDYGIPSVFTQLFYTTQWWFDIDPILFDPPPKVWSSVMSIHIKHEQLPEFDYQRFSSIVKTSFNQRRKMLRNTLKSFFSEASFANATLQPFLTMRPEQLSPNDFINISLLKN